MKRIKGHSVRLKLGRKVYAEIVLAIETKDLEPLILRNKWREKLPFYPGEYV